MHPDGLADVRPYRQEDALSLVVARSVLVGLAEVARRDGPVDGRDDLGQRDLLGRAGQDVTAPDPRLERTRPAPLRARRICSRYGWGSAVRSAMSRTEVGVSAPCRASERSALLA